MATKAPPRKGTAKPKDAAAAINDRLDEIEAGAVPTPEETTPEEPARQYATADLLGPAESFWTEEFYLQRTGVWVLVRSLDTVEMTELVELPDLFGYREVMLQVREIRQWKPDSGEERPKPLDGSAFSVEQTRYMAHIAHLAIVVPEAGPEPVECPDPTCELKHPASLWTVAQTRRMNPTDLEEVGAFALRGRLGQRVGPFSGRPPEPVTPDGATAGESIPEGTS